MLVALLALNLVSAASLVTPTLAILAAIWGLYRALTSKYKSDRLADKAEVEENARVRVNGLTAQLDSMAKANKESHEAIIRRLDYSNGRTNDLAKSENEQNERLARIEGRLDGREE